VENYIAYLEGKVLENRGRETIADMIDDILCGREYKARDRALDVLKDKTSDRIMELKKDFNSNLFDIKNTKS
jgi:hypothetical protein